MIDAPTLDVAFFNAMIDALESVESTSLTSPAQLAYRDSTIALLRAFATGADIAALMLKRTAEQIAGFDAEMEALGVCGHGDPVFGPICTEPRVQGGARCQSHEDAQDYIHRELGL